ncbi:UvrD-helicase domain-containing protein [Luteimonas sp. MC1825]|uniref:UvrD-helicase domain-containing protein n=1 Tax=Luteimonas sp. MC1825 TaxID=2761107 RepID=UPI00161FC85A|nr:UvrD-helicase domain-containing protein [Luteimonas sp. MC1825]MBB6600317.1 AAA family ATPase [Luteimonas sp. MC1825]QOC87994.1 AAA family ATPase [Luteimonas sp. MC1825]
MDEDLPRKLADFDSKGYVIAPAGYGKTHLIAKAVQAASRRQLVLTHTYAGVNAIRKKLRLLRIPSSQYQIDTIASWALRTCLYFPKTSKWKMEHPTAKDWANLYTTCAAMLDRPFVQHVIKCSYGGVFVDEYQDCSGEQHGLVESLARLIPCRLLGDPMQAIFGFGEQPVDWERDVYPNYKLLGELKEPWRWKLAGAEDLGQWLNQARALLAENERVALSGQLPKGVRRCAVDLNDFTNKKRLNVFFEFLNTGDSVMAIHSGDAKSKNKTHKLAQSLSGRFSSLEEVEGKDLHRFIKKVDGARSPGERLRLVIGFMKSCCNAVDGVLAAQTKRGEEGKATKTTRCPEILKVANRYLATESCEDMAALLGVIRDHPEVTTYRRDLLNRMMGVLRTHEENPGLTLMESASWYQREFRRSGRPLRHNKLIATTLLVKGLEYDHVIVLEAETMTSKDLYVAMTRRAKSVTFVTLANDAPT